MAAINSSTSPKFQPFSGVPHTLEDSTPSVTILSDPTSQPQPLGCCHYVKVIRDSLIALLVRIRDCFCRCFSPSTSKTSSQQTSTIPEPPSENTPDILPVPSVPTQVENPSASNDATGSSSRVASSSALAVQQPEINELEEVEESEEEGEEEIPLPHTIKLFFDFIDAMNQLLNEDEPLSEKQKLAITQQGLCLFTCLSLKDKYWMLLKLVTDFKSELSRFFPRFFKAIEDQEAQKLIHGYIVSALVKQVNSEASRPYFEQLIDNWLKEQLPGSADSPWSRVGEALTTSTQLKTIQVEAALTTSAQLKAHMWGREELTEIGAFVLKMVNGALARKTTDVIMRQEQGLTDFYRLSVVNQLRCIERLIIIAGPEERQLFDPHLILELINAVQGGALQKIIDAVMHAKRLDLIIKDKRILIGNMAMKDVQAVIYPIIAGGVNGKWLPYQF